MAQLVEHLESRQLFSATSLLATLYYDINVGVADVKSVLSVGHENFQAIQAELKGAGELKSSSAALHALASHASAANKLLSRNVLKTGPLIKADVKKFVAAAGRLAKKPTSLPLQRAEQAIVTKLRKDGAARLSAITASISNRAVVDKTYADRLIAANPGDANLKGVFAEASDHSGSALSTTQSTLTTVITYDVENVISAVVSKT